MAELWTPSVEHFIEEHAEIAYSGGMQEGNVDVREIFGNPLVAFANRSLVLQRTFPHAQYVLQVVQMSDQIEDISGRAGSALKGHYYTDGLITDTPGIVLGLNTADCFGVTMHDSREGKALGLIHAGRQGTQAGIHLDAMYKLIDEHNINGEDIRFNFSPGVHAKSYAFSPAIPDDMAVDDGWNDFIEEVDDESNGTRFHIDVLGRLLVELIDEGIKHTQISLRHAIDVGADPRFFSHTRAYRTGEPFGRNLIAAALRPAKR